MNAKKSLIAWNSPKDDRGHDDPASSAPRVIVVEKTDPYPKGWSYGYRSTNGACCADWLAANDDEVTLNILILFRRLALRGISVMEIHRAFMAIEEYRTASGLQIAPNGDEFNP